MAGNFNIWEIFYDIYVGLCYFIILDLCREKIAFHNLANPNLNLDCTDYADSCL